MTPEQIALVRSSLDALSPSKRDLASEFYGQLFAVDPRMPGLRGDDRAVREAGFTKQLDELVDSLTNFDALVEHSRELGRQLAAQGVRASHYRTGQKALMVVLQSTLGDRFDPATREAWNLACNLVAECMMAGASKR